MSKPTDNPETAYVFCKDVARFCFSEINVALVAYFAAIGKSEDELPETLQIRTDKWKTAEDEIEKAIAAEDINLTIDLCAQFKKRALATIADRVARTEIRTMEVAA